MKSALHDNGGPQDDAVTELRSLIVGPEQAEIKRLARKIEERKFLAEDAANVITEAVELRQGRDDSLSDVLAPTVESTLYKSVSRDPQTLADALFPIFGPAIRRAVASAMRGAVQNMNQTMDSLITAKGLRWRMEAWRTGRSYGDIVLKHSLLYQIEQVFLIQRETGLVIGHVSIDESITRDADLISSMLTAIGSFVHDSFEVRDEEQLETVEVGDVSVWIEPGPYAFLACVIRGTPPSDVRDVMQDALAEIHLTHGPDLSTMQEETSDSFIGRKLESCLMAEFHDSDRPVLSPATIVVIAILLLLVSAWAFVRLRDNGRWADYVDVLRSQQGLVVLDEGRDDGKFFVKGLRDPLAADPAAFVAGSGISADDVEPQWTPFQSTDSSLVIARARHVLSPPAGVTFSLDRGTLIAAGNPDDAWRSQATLLARVLPGVDRLVFDDAQARLTDLVRQVEALSLSFAPGGQGVGASEARALREVVPQLEEIRRLASNSGLKMNLVIVGHTDPSGTPEVNRSLRLRRAESVAEAIAESGVPMSDSNQALTIKVSGADSQSPAASTDRTLDQAMNRRVTFEFE